MSTPTKEYLDTLTRYYEEEVEGEAYFYAIAERLSDPEERRKMEMVAEVETYAAAAVEPLLQKYDLAPASREALAASGRKMAADSPGDFLHFLRKWQVEFPGYIDEFEALEAMAPAEDVPVLKILTDHEHAAIAFIEAELKGEANSTAPMQHYLETGTA
ncbi:hypothetical protein EI983_01480 [Roseovarius faecimaris]|uniref:DUF892 family protein n=1 Tax=Roseovarius faecimaris TaxID=2494550 RepID=A0A6I6IK86_9RHOB|nr:hypothetical protein [Roseovarius faecimaris]QGX97015.1 hypothetical protein EI983_01480 [Roseovarius faecimaris]